MVAVKKTNRRLFTAIWAFAAVGALSAAYLILGSTKYTEEPITEAAPIQPIVLVDKNKDDLSSVVFVNGDTTTVILPWIDEKSGNRVSWQAGGYETVNLNPSAMEGMIVPVYSLIPEKQVSPSDDNLPEYGLDQPGVIVTGRYYDGSEATLYVGALTPARDCYYIKMAGVPGVFLLRKSIGEKLFYTVNDMVYKAMPFINYDSVPYVFAKHRDHFEFDILYSEEEPETKEKIDTILHYIQEFTFYKAVEVLPRDLTPFGLYEPAYTFFLLDEWGNELCLHIGGDADDDLFFIIATDRPVVFTIEKEKIRTLFGMLGELRP